LKHQTKMKKKNVIMLLIAAMSSFCAYAQVDSIKVCKAYGTVHFITDEASNSNAPGNVFTFITLLNFEESIMSDSLIIERFLVGTEYEGLEIKRFYVKIGANPNLTWDQKEFILYPQQLMNGTRQNFKSNYENWSQGRYAIDNLIGVKLYMAEQKIKAHRSVVFGAIVFPLAPVAGIVALVNKNREHQALRVINYLESNQH